MKTFSVHRKYLTTFLVLTTFVLVAGFSFVSMHQTGAEAASTIIKKVSKDPYTNTTSQHQTQVEPDTFSAGKTVVSTFQSGRFVTGGGSSNIGWATSPDAGKTWQSGFLPGITVYAGGTYARVSDSVVAYDLAHHVWLIASLAAKTTFDNVTGSTVVVVSRSKSSDGLTWNNPITVAASSSSQNFDKDWLVCDRHSTSKFFGHCYAQWDDANNKGLIMMSVSTDGGLTWSQPASPASQSFSSQGGQPLVQPNGNVIVPIYGTDLTTGAQGIYSYMSTDGGVTWTNPILVDPVEFFNVAGTAPALYRGGSLPSAEIDANGKVYVAWAGCNFEQGCAPSTSSTSTGTDDIIFTTTTNGTTWTALQRIPLDPIGSGVEHLTAGLAVDNTTSGATAHLAVTYYYFPNANCTMQPCQLFVGFASSINGGATWSASQALAGPMDETWLANTDVGYMTGDYISTSIAATRAVTVVPVASAPNGQQFKQPMFGASVPVTGGSVPSETLSSTPATPPQAQKGTSAKNYRTGN